MKLGEVNLEDKGYSLMLQGFLSMGLSKEDVKVKFTEWTKRSPIMGAYINKVTVVRIYNSEDSRVIIYNKSMDSLTAPDILFNGRIDSPELLELIYTLVTSEYGQEEL